MFVIRILFCLAIFGFSTFCGDAPTPLPKRRFSVHSVLFKLLAMKDWQASQSSIAIKTPESDKDFIHFSTERQYQRVFNEKFKDKECVLLIIDPSQLNGRLVLEYNRSRTEQYYHLDGYIPKEAVLDFKVLNAKMT